MPKLPGRQGTTWSRRRDPIKAPSFTRHCPKHGDTEHRKYTFADGGRIELRCVECTREHNRQSRLNRLSETNYAPAYHPFHEEEPLAARNPICPTCHYETANNGTCGC